MILYLHGLNSAGTSDANPMDGQVPSGHGCPGSAKAAVLRERLAPIPVLSPTYPAHQPVQAVERLSRELETHTREALRDNQPLLLVGSSMGGFYGQYLARRFPLDHLVMINPALRPWELLRQVVGWQYNQALNERYYLSEEMVAATRRFAIEDVADGIPTTLLLDQGDELIDWRIAAAIYAGSGDIHDYPGGSHGFEHMDEAVGLIHSIHARLGQAHESLARKFHP
ncbi:MAG: YqiA/YcfP family alpha/beta fold hydrolase [Pseudomonadota bacterium]